MVDWRGLSTVQPDWFGIVDQDGEDGHYAVGCDRHEAGFETGDIGHGLLDGNAGLIKCRLCDGVILAFLVSDRN